jgi:hypothetical protein
VADNQEKSPTDADMPNGLKCRISLMELNKNQIAPQVWGRKRYMDMSHFKDLAPAPAAPNNLVAGEFA